MTGGNSICIAVSILPEMRLKRRTRRCGAWMFHAGEWESVPAPETFISPPRIRQPHL
jgi:hypothetical protein